MMPGGPTMMMMMPGGPGMGPGGQVGQGLNPRPKSNTHIVQPAPAPLTGQDSMGKGIFVLFLFLGLLFPHLQGFTHCQPCSGS